jgi:hypothetical protein
LSEFRDSAAGFVDLAAVRACVSRGIHERSPDRSVKYVAVVDCAGGGGEDAGALAIGHKAGQTVVLDLVRHIEPPFNPESTLEEFAEDLRRYRCTRVVGDGWAAGFPEQIFRKCGVSYVRADRTRSQYYLELLPILNARAADLLDNSKLVTQLANLERRPRSSGHDEIDAPPRQHEDLANAVAGCLVHAWELRGDRRDFDARARRERPMFANVGYAEVKRHMGLGLFRNFRNSERPSSNDGTGGYDESWNGIGGRD